MFGRIVISLLTISFISIVLSAAGCKDEESPAAPAPQQSLTGAWNISITGTTGSMAGTMSLTQVNQSVEGTIAFSGYGSTALSGGICTSNTVQFIFYSQESGWTARWEFNGTHNYSTMSGTVKVYDGNSQVMSAAWTAGKLNLAERLTVQGSMHRVWRLSGY